ncbi:MAG TPA: type II secretion system protein GspK [Polyangiaceae bacterium]
MKLPDWLTRKRTLRGKQRGVALIMVLAALTVLTVMLTEVQDESAAEFGAAMSARDAMVAEYAAVSGVNLARLLIASEPTVRRSLSLIFALLGGPRQIPVWQFADRILGAFNDKDAAAGFSLLAGVDPKKGKNLGLEGAGWELTIVDEDSKINLNLAARASLISELHEANEIISLIGPPQFSPMFEGRDADGQFSDRQAICAAILDWADPDQDQAVCDPTSSTAQQTGSEDSFYQLLKKPYQRKNAAFDSLEELHMVRGISDDFWSTFIDPDPDKPDKRNVTVWGQGQINVNTAPPMVLLTLVCEASKNTALVCTDPNEAQKFLMALTMLRGFLPGLPMFGSPKDFTAALQQTAAPAPGAAAPAMGGSPVQMVMQALGLQPIPLVSPAQTEASIGVESKVFSIYARGYVHSGKRETNVHIHAVVDFRGAPSPQQVMQQQLTNLMNQANGTGGASSTPPPAGSANQINGVTLPPGMTPDGIMSALKPGSGGNVVYYRVD